MTEHRDIKKNFRAFDAGRSQRRLRSLPTVAQSVNAQIAHYGRTVLARSRYLVNNNPYASAAKEAFVSSLVGDGIKPSSLITERDMREQIHEAWLEWTDEADADWLTDFYGLQSLIAAEMFEAGECFIRIRPRRPEDDLTIPFQLQLIPAEMLPFASNKDIRGARSARVQMGIEFDAIGRRTAYHFYRNHPGELRTDHTIDPNETHRVDASEILHLFRPTVVGQVRGVPHTISAVAKLAMMDQYDDAELERKRTAALFMGFVTRDMPEDDDETNPLPGLLEPAEPGYGEDVGLEPGAFANLEPGEDVKFAEPADVGGNYDVFQYRTLTAIATGFGVPYSSMTGDLRQTNYSSIRAGLVEHRRRIEAIQHHVMIYQFCRPIWQRWIREAVLAGVIPVSPSEFLRNRRRYSKVKWIPPHWEWVDPLDDLKAEKLAVDNGFKSRSDVIEAGGYDPEEVDRRIKADQDRARDLGLTIGTAAYTPTQQTTEEGLEGGNQRGASTEGTEE